MLREAAQAEASAGRETACDELEEALRLAADPRERAEIALEVAEAYAALFRWVDAVDVIERALEELGSADEALAARLEGELVVCGLHDARRAARVAPVLERLSSRSPRGARWRRSPSRAEWRWFSQGDPWRRPPPRCRKRSRARRAGGELGYTGRTVVEPGHGGAIRRGRDRAGTDGRRGQRSGSARGLVAVYSTLGLLRLRLGGLPEADAAARVALRVLQEGDFAPGLAFAATVLADVAVEAGELDEAQALLELLPGEGWPAGVGTVLIPAARGRLRLAQGRPADALADFRMCAAMFSPEVWGTEMRDVGYVHARAGAAQALLLLGEREAAREVAQAELADVRVFGAPRALGVALRIAGLAEGGQRGLELLHESVASLRARRHCWSSRNRWPSSGRRYAAPASAPLRASRLPRRSNSPPAAALARWPPARARSSRPPAPARGASGAPAWKRSPPASCGSCISRPRAAPTARSATSST